MARLSHNITDLDCRYFSSVFVGSITALAPFSPESFFVFTRVFIGHFAKRNAIVPLHSTPLENGRPGRLHPEKVDCPTNCNLWRNFAVRVGMHDGISFACNFNGRLLNFFGVLKPRLKRCCKSCGTKF